MPLIRLDDLSSASTRALLALHLRGMSVNSPPGHVLALDMSGLRAPEVTVWTAWTNGAAVGVIALRMFGETAAEIKSMRTHPDHVRRGIGQALLAHVLEEGRRRGLKRLSLETGSGEAFEPALALYRANGFTNGEPFADYTRSAFNQFLHLDL